MRTVVGLFDGMSCGRISLDKAGIQYDHYFASEIDKFAVAESKANYPDTFHMGDITRWREWNIDWTQVDMVIGGSPCFVAGTSVVTLGGYKNIEDVATEDYVLSHNNKWRKVIRVGGKLADTLILKAQGMLNTETTHEHPYYVRTMNKSWDNEKRRYVKTLSEPFWKKAGELCAGDFLSIPVIKDETNRFYLTDEECFIIGRYIADGHTRNDFRTTEGRPLDRHWQLILSVGSHKIPKIEIRHSLYEHGRSVHRMVFSSKRLVEIVEKECGKGAVNKKISQELLDLPVHKLEKLIDGLLSGDGSKRKDEYRLTTVSKELAQSLCLAICKVYGVAASIEFTVRPKTTVIEGRTVNQRDTYTVSFRKERKKHSHFHVTESHVWVPFKGSNDTGNTRQVFNLEVATDNSYTANNVVVHNCQGFSFAGKQLAFDDPRSKLFFTFIDILRAAKFFNPNVKFMLENVKMKKEHLDVITEELFFATHTKDDWEVVE